MAGPEAANNASAAGTLVPMLSLGLPTNATAAVMLTAFVSYGIQPGPTLFDKEPLLIWTLIASLFIGNLMLLVLNLPLAPLWAKLLRTPRPYLYAGILFFATLGALAVNIQPLDLVLLLVFGLLGLMMRRFGLPVLPLIIGVILGPRIERQLRQSLQLGGGDWSSLLHEPVAIVVYVCMALLISFPLVLRLFHRDEPDIIHATADDFEPLDRQGQVSGLGLDLSRRHRPHSRRGRRPMIVAGYTADGFGRAALTYGVAEAKLRANGPAGDQRDRRRCLRRLPFRPCRAVADIGAYLNECGVRFELTQPVGVDSADELLKAMDRPDTELLVIGIRNRSPVGKLLLGSVSRG